MREARVAELLAQFGHLRVALVGDFFLDRYWTVEPALTEVSIETGLEAFQVTGARTSPGAAGTVASNLLALGLGTLWPVGVIGEDGEGYELKRGLVERGADLSHLYESPLRATPTYTKPMRLTSGGEVEMNRFDRKNRVPLPADLEAQVIASLEALLTEVHAIVVMDQVQEEDCGVVTGPVRDWLAGVASRRPDVVVLADSRARINRFTNVALKLNLAEGSRAAGVAEPSPEDTAALSALSARLLAQSGQAVLLTLGEKGVFTKAPNLERLVPSVPVEGPVDIVGAGDSFSAGAALSLASGATLAEAAAIGNLVASITVQQLGTTGTASPEQVLARFREKGSQFADIE